MDGELLPLLLLILLLSALARMEQISFHSQRVYRLLSKALHTREEPLAQDPQLQYLFY
jgi:hypothetical protein